MLYAPFYLLHTAFNITITMHFSEVEGKKPERCFIPLASHIRWEKMCIFIHVTLTLFLKFQFKQWKIYRLQCNQFLNAIKSAF